MTGDEEFEAGYQDMGTASFVGGSRVQQPHLPARGAGLALEELGNGRGDLVSVAVEVVTPDPRFGLGVWSEDPSFLHIAGVADPPTILVSGDAGGLLSMARYLLSLGQEDVLDGSHHDFDTYMGWFDEGSIALRLERAGRGGFGPRFTGPNRGTDRGRGRLTGFVSVDIPRFDPAVEARFWWESGAELRADLRDNPERIAVFNGNPAGLNSFARHCLTLGQSSVPSGASAEFSIAQWDRPGDIVVRVIRQEPSAHDLR